MNNVNKKDSKGFLTLYFKEFACFKMSSSEGFILIFPYALALII
jgi:hypothetical protein